MLYKRIKIIWVFIASIFLIASCGDDKDIKTYEEENEGHKEISIEDAVYKFENKHFENCSTFFEASIIIMSRFNEKLDIAYEGNISVVHIIDSLKQYVLKAETFENEYSKTCPDLYNEYIGVKNYSMDNYKNKISDINKLLDNQKKWQEKLNQIESQIQANLNQVEKKLKNLESNPAD